MVLTSISWTFTGQRSLEWLVQRELVTRLLDQEHGDAAAVARQNDAITVEQETFHTGPVRGVWPVERPGAVLAGQQRPDQLQQHSRAYKESLDARQSASRRWVQRKLSQLAAAPGKFLSFRWKTTYVGALLCRRLGFANPWPRPLLEHTKLRVKQCR